MNGTEVGENLRTTVADGTVSGTLLHLFIRHPSPPLKNSVCLMTEIDQQFSVRIFGNGESLVWLLE